MPHGYRNTASPNRTQAMRAADAAVTEQLQRAGEAMATEEVRELVGKFEAMSTQQATADPRAMSVCQAWQDAGAEMEARLGAMGLADMSMATRQALVCVSAVGLMAAMELFAKH